MAGLNSWERTSGTKEALDPELVFAFIILREEGFIHSSLVRGLFGTSEAHAGICTERQNKHKHPNINRRLEAIFFSSSFPSPEPFPPFNQR